MSPRLSHLLATVGDVAASQRGLVTAKQLEAIGVPRSSARYRARAAGPWRYVLPGIYLVGGGPPSDEQRLLAAVLYGWQPCMITGAAALALYGVTSERPPREVHLLVPHNRGRSSSGFVVVERTTKWPEARSVTGLPVAPLARAVLDATRRMGSGPAVQSIVGRIVQQGRCTPHDLQAELEAAQRRGTRLVREAIELVSAGPISAAEMDLYGKWRASGLPEALWNVDLYTPEGEFLSRPDAFVPPAVAFELDSRTYHLDAPDWQRTMERHSRMTARGLLVLHHAPRRVLDRWDAVAAEVVQTARRFADSGAKPPDIVVRPRATPESSA